VRLLVLTHLSQRHLARELRDEARAVFPNAVAPHDFDTIEIPFPERGEPMLVRWEDRRAPAEAPA
jgi:ribonuclease Z